MTTAPHIDTHLDRKALQALARHVKKAFPKLESGINAVRELTLTVPAAQLPQALQFLRDDGACRFTQLMDVCGVDYLGHTPAQPRRFAVVYHLLSLSLNQRIRVKVWLDDGQTVPTATNLFAAAGWFEREAYDMYGIVFEGHPDLRRILTDYDFVGFPLRKDFPLQGHVEVYYDVSEQRVAYKPVDLPQNFRHFDRVSEWQGITGNTGLADTDNTFNNEEFK